MKWKNKGHELDDMAEKIVQNFESHNKKIFLFGAGKIGNDIRLIVERYHIFGGFIDNSIEKQRNGVFGKKVLSLCQFMKNNGKGLIVISVADDSIGNDIERKLTEQGLEKGIDFFPYAEFMGRILPVLSFYRYGSLYVDTVQISLTERCTLKCKKCAHGCHMVTADCKDMEIEQAFESADNFFANIDLVGEFTLIGGEPFLYKKLADVIRYIGERYRNKIIIFSITTNGTIVPEEAILELCRKYHVLLRISNYAGTLIFLERKYAQLQRVLEESRVEYVLGKREKQWMDYGFEEVDHGEEEKELVHIFDECGTPCREIRGNKYYYCVMARSISENLKMGIGKNDYLDLNRLTDKKELLEFNMGYSEKGYLDMCRHCNGGDAVKYLIPAAEQMSRNYE